MAGPDGPRSSACSNSVITKTVIAGVVATTVNTVPVKSERDGVVEPVIVTVTLPAASMV